MNFIESHCSFLPAQFSLFQFLHPWFGKPALKCSENNFAFTIYNFFIVLVWFFSDSYGCRREPQSFNCLTSFLMIEIKAETTIIFGIPSQYCKAFKIHVATRANNWKIMLLLRWPSMALSQQKDLTFTSVVVKISPSNNNGYMYLYLFFILQSFVDQMWNCNKDLWLWNSLWHENLHDQ